MWSLCFIQKFYSILWSETFNKAIKIFGLFKGLLINDIRLKEGVGARQTLIIDKILTLPWKKGKGNLQLTRLIRFKINIFILIETEYHNTISSK